MTQRGQHALGDAEDLRERQRADERPQRPARDVLHGDVGHAAVLEEVEQRDHVRMVEPSGESGLLDEALGQPRIVALQVERLSTTWRSSTGWRTR